MPEHKPDIYIRYRIPTTVTVEIDTRERHPLPFPATISIPNPEASSTRDSLLIKVQTHKIKLPYGDYRLAEYPACCVVERKGGARELSKNLTDARDSVRQARSLRKLTTCEYPYLLIEAPIDSLWDTNTNPEHLLSYLSTMMLKYGLQLMWLPWGNKGAASRRRVGALLIHLMLTCAIHKTLDVLPDVLYNTGLDED